MIRRSWKEFKGVAARRIPDEIRSSINPSGEITFDLDTFKKLGEPEAMFLFYEESTRTIGLKPAHPDAHNAVLVRVRHARSNRVVRSRPFMRENGIELEHSLRFPFPFIEDKVLILDLRTAVTCSRGGWKKAKKKPPSLRAVRASLSGLKHAINDHDKEIWIESEDRLGKPVVWYSIDSKGRKKKHVRDSLGIRISLDEE
ncbi:MAG: hypothetical protein IPL32_14940 [Chloracidobacterium sp.]|nr:hypothetical protein [Chloracidobacterium sp.]